MHICVRSKLMLVFYRKHTLRIQQRRYFILNGHLRFISRTSAQNQEVKNIPFIHSKTISDQRGRHLIVCGTLNSIPLTLVNVYGHNYDDPTLFQNLCQIYSTQTWSGDFNCALHPVLDRQRLQVSSFKNSRTFNNLMQSSNVLDIWRLLYPTARDCSYFSKVHKSYSRTDYFLLDSKLMTSVADCTYHNILISDHSPVSLSLKLNHEKGEYSWCCKMPCWRIRNFAYISLIN